MWEIEKKLPKDLSKIGILEKKTTKHVLILTSYN